MDKITKLSQAIRLGASFTEPCSGNYFQWGVDTDDTEAQARVVRTCALGAAYLGIGGDPEALGLQLHDALKRILRQRFGVKPRVLEDIIFLNDTIGLAREDIASHLEKKGL